VLPRRYPFGVVDAPPHSSLRLAQLLTVCGCIIGMPLMYLYMKKKHFETHYIGEPARWVARRRSLTDRRPHPSAAWVAAGTMVLLTIPIALLGVRSRRDVRSHTCAGTPRVRQPPLFQFSPSPDCATRHGDLRPPPATPCRAYSVDGAPRLTTPALQRPSRGAALLGAAARSPFPPSRAQPIVFGIDNWMALRFKGFALYWTALTGWYEAWCVSSLPPPPPRISL